MTRKKLEATSAYENDATSNRLNFHSKRITEVRDKLIGQQIRSRRTVLGMSQQDLAKQLGISFQQLQKYEKGTNRTTTTRLIDIAKILRTSIGYFLVSATQDDENSGMAVLNDVKSHSELVQENEEESNTTNGPKNRELLELNRAFTRIPDKFTRRQVINLIRSISLMNSENSANE